MSEQIKNTEIRKNNTRIKKALAMTALTGAIFGPAILGQIGETTEERQQNATSAMGIMGVEALAAGTLLAGTKVMNATRKRENDALEATNKDPYANL